MPCGSSPWPAATCRATTTSSSPNATAAQVARQDFDEEVWQRFSARLDYFPMDAAQSADFGRLARYPASPAG
jgi:glucose-6-phosphate 1-dehydrogenase